MGKSLPANERSERAEMRLLAHAMLLRTVIEDMDRAGGLDTDTVRRRTCDTLDDLLVKPGLTPTGHHRLQLALAEIEEILGSF